MGFTMQLIIPNIMHNYFIHMMGAKMQKRIGKKTWNEFKNH
jgi:hypothetical protein